MRHIRVDVRLLVAAAVAAAAVGLGVPSASAQVPPQVKINGRNGIVRQTTACDVTVSVVPDLAYIEVQIVGAATGPLLVPVTWSFDLSDGSTPRVGTGIQILSGETKMITQPNTGTATGSMTATMTAPPGYSIAGPASVTVLIALDSVSADCPATTSAPTPPPAVDAPPAVPVAAAPSLTG